jgi:signal transduction histidine kinase
VTLAATAAPAAWIRARGPAILGGTAACGIAAAVATAWLVSGSRVLADPGTTAVARALLVGTYAVGGAFTWWWRPTSRLGPLIAAYGFLYAASSLDAVSAPVPFTLGRILAAAAVVCLFYVFACFPRDRLESRVERIGVPSVIAAGVVVSLAALTLSSDLPAAGAFRTCRHACPANGLQLVSVPSGVERGIDAAAALVAIVGVAFLVWLLLERRRSRALVQRRAIEPVLAAAAALALAYGAFAVLQPSGGVLFSGLRAATAAAGVAVPLALLLGQVGATIAPARNVARFVPRLERMSPEDIERLMREVLGDPTLVLALWAPEQSAFVAVDGAVVATHGGGRNRVVTPLERRGRPFAAVVHDPLLDDGRGTVEGIATICLMLLENMRLVDELRASQLRFATAAYTERVRLERNLHDGAQQRLLNLQFRILNTAEAVHGNGTRGELEAIANEAAGAAAELRALARGLYPALLRERGVVDSLREVALAARTPIRIVDGVGAARYPSAIEAAVYFSAHEAIQNAAKHAGAAAKVTVRVDRREDDLVFSIADDGAGFDVAVESGGTGLVGMRDRLAAVGGVVDISSTRGRGTTVVGTVPLPRGEPLA